MQMKRKIKDYILIIFKGIGMGAADVIPGVSGGTIAFITGIYEELLSSIKNLPVACKTLISSKFNFRLFWKEANGNFLTALLLGIGISIFSLAKLMTYLLANHPIPVWSFFFGLILASVWFVLKDIDKWKPSYCVSLICGIAAGYLITVISPSETPDDLWFIFLSGAIAICAMILPGISGSFILLLMGKYAYILAALQRFDMLVISVFSAGAIIGIISFSHFLSWLLKNFHFLTIAFLAGIMFGSLNKIWPWKQVLESTTNSHGEVIPLLEKNILPNTYSEINNSPSLFLYAIAIMAAGFLIIFAIDIVAAKLKKNNELSQKH
jgi:putative membrane protein